MKYYKIITEICKEENIKYQILSNDYLLKLEKNGKRKFIYAYKFPLNDQAVGKILDDKYAFYSVLKEKSFPIVDMLFLDHNYNRDEVLKYLKKHGQVVLKPNLGTCGRGVYRISFESELLEKINELFKKNSFLCLSPYYSIVHEYRVIVLNRDIKLVYRKENPKIIGDGVSSIGSLLLKFNPTYFQDSKKMQKIKIDLNQVLSKGTELEIDFRFNLSRGSKASLLLDPIMLKRVKEQAISVMKYLDLQFASIDIIELENHELKILEANSGVMMDSIQKQIDGGYEIVKEIYREAILSLF